MKRFISVFLIISLLVVMSGCANNKTLDYKDPKTKVESKITFQPYGFFDTDKKNPNVYYSISIGNIIWSLIFSETLIIPVILCGWYLWEPVNQISNEGVVGAVN